ncbi:hypothetical protein V1517DRAFT_325017 [Lipomyces orientalis]|uniref:Uncharacterized protein n=1 Tax=Lipomyces orientalis TaxID=1233043 RepID=A0ACC3TP56_9ASCO
MPEEISSVKPQVSIRHQELRTSERDCESSLDLAMRQSNDEDGMPDQLVVAIDGGLMDPAFIDDCLEVQRDSKQESADEYEYEYDFDLGSEGSDLAEDRVRGNVDDLIFDSTTSTEVDTVVVEPTSSGHQDGEQLPSTPSPQDADSHDPTIVTFRDNDNSSSPHAESPNELVVSRMASDLDTNSAEVLDMSGEYTELPTPVDNSNLTAVPSQSFGIANDTNDLNLSPMTADHGSPDPEIPACLPNDSGPVEGEGETQTPETIQDIDINNDSESIRTSTHDDKLPSNTHSVPTISLANSTIVEECSVATDGSIDGGVPGPLDTSTEQPPNPSNSKWMTHPASNTVKLETQIKNVPEAKSPLDFITAKEAKEAAIKARIQEKQARLADSQKEYDEYIKKLKLATYPICGGEITY